MALAKCYTKPKSFFKDNNSSIIVRSVSDEWKVLKQRTVMSLFSMSRTRQNKLVCFSFFKSKVSEKAYRKTFEE